MHGVNEAQAFLNATIFYHLFDLRGNIEKFLAVLRIKPEILGMGFHYLSNSFALKQKGDHRFWIRLTKLIGNLVISAPAFSINKRVNPGNFIMNNACKDNRVNINYTIRIEPVQEVGYQLWHIFCFRRRVFNNFFEARDWLMNEHYGFWLLFLA
jgi:hypothetical protein